MLDSHEFLTPLKIHLHHNAERKTTQKTDGQINTFNRPPMYCALPHTHSYTQITFLTGTLKKSFTYHHYQKLWLLFDFRS